MEVMIDIETLGVGTEPVIFQIGWCLFSTEEDETVVGCVDLSIAEQIIRGRTIDDHTVAWWRSRKRMTSGGVNSTKAALERLASVIQPGDTIWAGPAHFDIPRLESLFRMFEVEVPWKYTQVRCSRTIRKWFGDRQDLENDHHAGRDAENQAKTLKERMNRARED
ncbi:MAG: hypothetical protein COA69_09515 [Robiginitomaculum sp.]|nr:MAG: hypothetical protein COA69_09515 [Robiginitomaculum sp.]